MSTQQNSIPVNQIHRLLHSKKNLHFKFQTEKHQEHPTWKLEMLLKVLSCLTIGDVRTELKMMMTSKFSR